MKTKELVLLGLFMAMGTALHLIIPPSLGSMKPDMLLTMMFLGITLFPRVGNVVLLGLASGILSALTTGFPAGQIPNIVDKFFTAFIFFGLLMAFRKIGAQLAKIVILTAVGTFVSGMIFLGTAFIFFELPDAFFALTVGIVLPAVAVNSILMFIIYPIASKLTQRLQFQTTSTQVIAKK